MMKKSAAILIAFAVIIGAVFSGCKVQSVKEHDAGAVTASDSVTAYYDDTEPSERTASQTGTTVVSDEKETSAASTTGTAKKTTAKSGEKPATTGGKAVTKVRTTAKSTSATTQKSTTRSAYITVSVSINSSAAEGKSSFLPGGTYTVKVKRSSSVYEATRAALNSAGISLSAQNSAFGTYVNAIGGLAEKDCGARSGWKYAVNNKFPGVSCSEKTLSDSDSILWIYVLN